MERSTKGGRFRRSLAFVIAALIIQYLLGMAVTLFVTIPTDHPRAHPPEYFGGVAASVGWAILHGRACRDCRSLRHGPASRVRCALSAARAGVSKEKASRSVAPSTGWTSACSIP